MKALKSSLIVAATVGALVALAAANPAAATPIYTFDPMAIPGTTGAGTSVQASDVSIFTDATIYQGTNLQTEYGAGYVTLLSNNGVGLKTGVDGLAVDQIFIAFQATVNGVSSFSPGASGTIAPGGFTYTLFADEGQNDNLNPGTFSTNPTITGPDTTVALAVGASITGSAGVQAGTLGPILSAVSSFIICDGTPNMGTINGKTVAATGCGSFDARTYFTAPVPFYNVSFNSATAGSLDNLACAAGTGAACAGATSATLDGAVASVNFAQVPEPETLAMFGFGLIGLGWFARRRVRNS